MGSAEVGIARSVLASADSTTSAPGTTSGTDLTGQRIGRRQWRLGHRCDKRGVSEGERAMRNKASRIRAGCRGAREQARCFYLEAVDAGRIRTVIAEVQGALVGSDSPLVDVPGTSL